MNATITNQNPTIQAAEEPKNYRKTVLELYVDAVEAVCISKKSAQQVSIKGNEFKGLNNNILANTKYKSNVWFSENQIKEMGFELISTDEQGVTLFTTSLRDIPNKTYKERVLRYWKVFNREQLQEIPV